MGTLIRRGWLACLAGLALTLSGIDAAAGADTLRIGVVRDADASPSVSAPLFIARDSQLLERAGVTPDIRSMSETALHRALADGEVDVGFTVLSARFYRRAWTDSLKVIASAASDQTGFPQYVVLIAPGASTAAQDLRALNGMTVGTADLESPSVYALFNAAARFGVTGITRIAIATPRTAGRWPRSPQVTSGSGGAALVLARGAASGVRVRGVRVLRLSDYTLTQTDGVVASTRTITQRRELLQHFVAAYQRASAEYQINFLQYDDGGDFIPGPRYAQDLAIIARASGAAPAVVAASKTYHDPHAYLNLADMARQVEFWKGRDRLDRQVELARLVDLSFTGQPDTALTAPP